MKQIETATLHRGVAGARHTFLPLPPTANKLDLLLQVCWTLLLMKRLVVDGLSMNGLSVNGLPMNGLQRRWRGLQQHMRGQARRLLCRAPG